MSPLCHGLCCSGERVQFDKKMRWQLTSKWNHCDSSGNDASVWPCRPPASWDLASFTTGAATQWEVAGKPVAGKLVQIIWLLLIFTMEQSTNHCHLKGIWNVSKSTRFIFSTNFLFSIAKEADKSKKMQFGKMIF